ncbi:MAG: glycoside hydrolase family 16 protein [Patescibacteria group bacterium]
MQSKIIYLFLLLIIFIPVSTTNGAENKLSFANYEWTTRNYFGNPGNNNWDNSTQNIFVDKAGLHLKISQIGDKWYSSSLHLNKSLGFGTYEFIVSTPINQQSLNTIVGLFIYENDSRELDIELGKWSEQTKNNLHYSVQPYSIEGNSKGVGFNPTNNGEEIYRIDWQKDSVKFSASADNGATYSEWLYTGANNFAPGNESVHINFWQIKGLPPTNNQTQEVVIKKFKFIPPNSPTTIISQPLPTTEPRIEIKPLIIPAPTNLEIKSPTKDSEIKKIVPENKIVKNKPIKKENELSAKTTQNSKNSFRQNLKIFSDKIKTFFSKKQNQ